MAGSNNFLSFTVAPELFLSTQLIWVPVNPLGKRSCSALLGFVSVLQRLFQESKKKQQLIALWWLLITCPSHDLKCCHTWQEMAWSWFHRMMAFLMLKGLFCLFQQRTTTRAPVCMACYGVKDFSSANPHQNFLSFQWKQEQGCYSSILEVGVYILTIKNPNKTTKQKTRSET